MSRRITQEELNNIIADHEKWLDGKGGERAVFDNVILCTVNIVRARLDFAIFKNVRFNVVDIALTSLKQANFSFVAFRSTAFRNCDLRSANIYQCCFDDSMIQESQVADCSFIITYLAGLTLREMKPEDIAKSNLDVAIPLSCPEKGSYTAYKAAYGKNRKSYIIELRIPTNAKRSSAATRKCRASKAKVISITNLDGSNPGIRSCWSTYDPSFVYEVGRTVKVRNFDENRWDECAPGIHHFLTRDEAVRWLR